MKICKLLLIFLLGITFNNNTIAQFGPIGYDFKDPYLEFENLSFAVRLSTDNNIYCPDEEALIVDNSKSGKITFSSKILSSAGGQINNPGRIELTLSKIGPTRISITAKASHPTEICKTILVLIKGIDVNSFVSEYPQAKGVNEFNRNKNILVSYPSRKATMPLIFITTPQEEWFVISKDQGLRRKGFACFYDHLSKEPVIVLSHDEDSRKLSNSIESQEWNIGSREDRIDLVRERCNDLEQNFNSLPYKKKSDTKWIDDLKLVVFFQGMHWTGHMFNTYDQMGDQLEWTCESIDGENIMAFLPAWDGRYYNTYPEHEPSERMGGKEGLNKFIKRAHDLNVKVVLMLGGPNMANFRFLEEHDMMDAALTGPDGFPQIQNWLDWNADLSIETMGLIMNFGHPKYRKYMVDKTAELFDSYDADGIFLDGTLRWENSPDYSPYEGLIEYTNEIRARYPSKMLMGEDGYDLIYNLFDMFHTSGGPLGLENFLLRYTRQFYYLSYPAENGSAGIHELGWSLNSPTINSAQPGYTIPSISLFDGIIETYGDTIRNKILKYKNWELKESPIMNR